MKKKTGIPFDKAASVLYLSSILCVSPLYFEDGYFNMLQAKARICGICLTLFALAMLLWYLLGRGKREGRGIPLSPLEWAMLSLAAVSLLSCLFSGRPAASFWGTEGWGVGAFAFLCAALSVILLSRHLPYGHNLWLGPAACTILVFLIAILHGAGVDVFHLHAWLAPEQVFLYLSTVGNLNWYSGYLSLLVPVFAVFYCSAETKATQIICLLFLLPANLNLVLCGSDSLFLAMGFAAFFALPYLLAEHQRRVRICILTTLYGLSLLFLGQCAVFSLWVSSFEGIAGRALNWNISALITLSGAAGALYAGCYRKQLGKKELRRLTVVLELALLAVAMGFFIHTLHSFDDNWGTGRGLTWRTSLELFQQFSVREKLLGIGPELLGSRYTALSAQFSRPILSAHSAPLQILLTTGIAGLTCWGAVWFWVFGSYFQKQVWKGEGIAFFLPLAAYFAQSMVNGPQPLNVAVLAVMLAVYQINIRAAPRLI